MVIFEVNEFCFAISVKFVMVLLLALVCVFRFNKSILTEMRIPVNTFIRISCFY